MSFYPLGEKVCDRPLSALVALPFGRCSSSHLGTRVYTAPGRKSARSGLVALAFDRFFASSQLGALVYLPWAPLSSYPSNPLVCVMPTLNGGPEGGPGHSQGSLGPPMGPWVPKGPWVPSGSLGRVPWGPLGCPGVPRAPGSLGPEALRAGGLERHGATLPGGSMLLRGLAVCGEAGSRLLFFYGFDVGVFIVLPLDILCGISKNP